MCELQWDILAKISLKNQENAQETICLCSRVFIRTKGNAKRNVIEKTESDDEECSGEELETGVETEDVQKCVKSENEVENLSCYCSASHTDTISTDEHDSIRDNQEQFSKGNIHQSDSGADLTDFCKSDIEWNKFWSINGEKLIWESWIGKYSAYINPDYLQYAQENADEIPSGLVIENTTSKSSKFSFDTKDLQYVSEHQRKDSPQIERSDCSSKNRVLIRHLSDSDEKINAEVSEGWNPLSPSSIEAETEAERLLSSRCGSHASGSARTVDSMTNVTRLTISSLELSNSTSSSDSFSSVSSVNSSLSSDETEEDYQHQWNILWKKHYEEEYLEQYQKFIESMSESTNLGQLLEDLSMDNEKEYINEHTAADEYKEPMTDEDYKEEQTTDEEGKKEQTTDEETEDSTLQIEMAALGLPISFGKQKRNGSDQRKRFPIEKSDSFNAKRNKIQAAFNLLGVKFQTEDDNPVSGTVEYKMKNIRHENRQLKMRMEPKKPKHLYFDDDGNVLPNVDDPEEVEFSEDSSDSSVENFSSCDEEIVATDEDRIEQVTLNRKRTRKKKAFMRPQEIIENPNLERFWKNRFSLFTKYDQGIKLDAESWYSVSPEVIAKYTADRCKCDVIIDGFCGAGGNTIQFALTCKKVIAIDIDPNKIELARHNAAIYGVANKIEFLVGDFLELINTLKADVVFLSPPWGGPSYVKTKVYDLETMLRPVPVSHLLSEAFKISKNVAIFLPKNSNTYPLTIAAGPGGRVELEKNVVNGRCKAITAFYNNLIKS